MVDFLPMVEGLARLPPLALAHFPLVRLVACFAAPNGPIGLPVPPQMDLSSHVHQAFLLSVAPWHPVLAHNMGHQMDQVSLGMHCGP